MQKIHFTSMLIILFYKFERKNEFFRSYLYFIINNYWRNLLSN